MMTREEALEELERLLRHWDDLENDKRCFWGYDKEAVALALSALRPITREQVEKMRGEWQVCFEEWQNHRVEGEQCSKCGFQNYGPSNLYNFCPKCGSPITDKAVDMMMERIEAVRNES